MGGFISRKQPKDQSPASPSRTTCSDAKFDSPVATKVERIRPPCLQSTPQRPQNSLDVMSPQSKDEFMSPLAAQAAQEHKLYDASPSVHHFTSQILDALGKEEDHGFEQLEGDDDEDEETEAIETSLDALEEEFNHSLSSAEIRCIGNVKRWQRGNLLGSGSYGRVFMAMNSDTGEIFVVKQVQFMNAHAGPSEEFAQLEMEIALLRTLNHPNIVKYYGTERNNVTCELSIFLEHMPGGSIAELVSRFGKLDESVIRKYTREVLEGLIYLHDKGIIHRDIKGQNILVDNHGICKLADFGASRHMQSTESAQNMSFKGTPVFMSPEVILEQRYSKKSDIWSVGCTVLQMATGNPPFSEFSNHIAALFHISSSTEPPPVPEELSDQLRSFANLCFQRDVKLRPYATGLRKHPFLASTNSSSAAKKKRDSPKLAGGSADSTPSAASAAGASAGALEVDKEAVAAADNDDADEQFKRFFEARKQTTKVTAVLRRQKSKGRKTGGGLMGENDSDASQTMTLGPNDTGSGKNGDVMFLGVQGRSKSDMTLTPLLLKPPPPETEYSGDGKGDGRGSLVRKK